MRVGVRMFDAFQMDSIRRIAITFYEALAAGHELVFMPPQYGYVSNRDRERLAEEFIERCDVVCGLPDPALTSARKRLGSDVPFVFFTLGGLPMGAWSLKGWMSELTTRDVLLVNCTSDLELADRFFSNAQARMIPFAFDPAAFYPLDEAERRAARERLGFGEDDRIILYAGRISPEKNVHTLLSIFGVIGRRVPDARLVVTGEIMAGGVLNIIPVSYYNTFSKILSRLDLPERLHMIGHSNTERMRELYNIADVKVNLTLNPDENFGLAQVEAMACGTPVVGTAWGGLKDTIVDGVTGYKVSTVATATGVKLNWWEAINKTVALLEDRPARERFREACVRHAVRYSQDAFGAQMEEILAAACASRGGPAEPLQPTAFAREFWSVCDPRSPSAPFRRGPRSEQLYRDLVSPFTAAAAEHLAAAEPLEGSQVLSLATPVEVDDAGGIRVDHTLFPFRVEVPAAHVAGVRAVLAVMREEPAITVGRLTGSRLWSVPDVLDALQWVLDAGLVLRTRATAGWLAPALVDGRLAEVLFSVQQIDRKATDLVVYQ